MNLSKLTHSLTAQPSSLHQNTFAADQFIASKDDLGQIQAVSSGWATDTVFTNRGDYLSRKKTHARPSRFSLSELLAMEFTEPEYLVDGLLPQGLMMLAGAPKLGKSWMVLDLAYRIAAGKPFLGHTVKQGDVLYLALEDNPRRLSERVQLLAPELSEASNDLPLEFWTACARMDTGGLLALEEWLTRVKNPRCIVIDVWGRFAPLEGGASRNEYQQLTSHLQTLQALGLKYGVSIVLVHHTKKTNGDGQGGDPFDQVLGSRALTSNMDTTLVLTRSRFQKDATLGITGRDVEEQEVAVTFNQDTHRWDVADRPQTMALPAERQKILDLVTDGITKTPDIVRQSGKSRTAVQNLLKALEDDGYISRVGKGEWKLVDALPAIPELTDDMNDNVTFEDPFDYI